MAPLPPAPPPPASVPMSPHPHHPASKLANWHEQVSVLFMDCVGFTTMSRQVCATEVMEFLNDLFTRLDNLVDDFGL